jgi:hypothetical protein
VQICPWRRQYPQQPILWDLPGLRVYPSDALGTEWRECDDYCCSRLIFYDIECIWLWSVQVCGRLRYLSVTLQANMVSLLLARVTIDVQQAGPLAPVNAKSCRGLICIMCL